VLLNELKRLGRQSAVYGAGTILSRLGGLILLPVYTRYLSPSDYGVVETLLTGAAVLIALLGAGVTSGFFRYWFEAPTELDRRRLFRTAWLFILASSTLGLVVCLVAADPLSSLIFNDSKWTNLIRLTGFFVWTQMNYDLLMALFRVEERPFAFVSVSIATSASTVVASLILVVVLEGGAEGMLASMAVGMFSLVLILLVVRRRSLGVGMDRHTLRRMNRFGLPLVPVGLLLALLYFSDRFFLVQLAGTDEAGRYAVAARIASGLMLLFIGFRMAWPAFAYSIRDDDDARRTYGFVLTYVVYVIAWGAVMLSALGNWLVEVLASPQFSGAEDAIPFLTLGTTAWAAYTVVSVALSRTGHTKANWPLVLAALVVDVALNLALVPRYGLVGSAMANVCAYWTMFGLMVAVAQPIYRVPYQWLRLARLMITALAMILLAAVLDMPLFLKVALAASFPLLLIPSGFYLPTEWQRIRRIAARVV
jgi:O-antigen/teichoic acid export membrane protein